MAWIDRWLKYASDFAVQQEAFNRGMFNTIEPLKVYGTITAQELASLLPSTYVGWDGKTYQVRKDIGFDTQYNLTSIEEVRRFLRWCTVDLRQYTKDNYDCEDYAISTWGDYKKVGNNSILGFMIVEGHAQNWVLDYKKQFYYPEPQSDVVKPGLPARAAHFIL